MQIIISFLLIINIIVSIAIDILAWLYIGWQVGVACLLGTIIFLIAYGVSVETLSPRDYFENDEWGLFCKKLGWAWGTAGIVYALSYIFIAYKFGDVLDIMPK